MNPDHLIEIAEAILQIGAGYPRQASINRAVSTAYYPLFHTLSAVFVAQTLGSLRSARYWEIVTPVYRAIDHASARKAFDRTVKDSTSPEPSRELGRAFVDLQAARIAADYDPGSRCTRPEAIDLIAQARDAIDTLRTLPKEDRLLLVAQLIAKPR